MTTLTGAVTRNGSAVKAADVPVSGIEEFRQRLIDAPRQGGHIKALFVASSGPRMIWGVVGFGGSASLEISAAPLGDAYRSMTPDCPQLHMFEREIFERSGVVPEGHPWLKPVRDPLEYTEFFKVTGNEIHEVAVGPVHAGVIEPGHFRFQCHGEQVLHLETSLGYQHRGIEGRLAGGPHRITPFQIETIAGDSCIAHMTAYCRAIEGLSRASVPARASAVRALGLELERIANHIGDLGALSGDIGFLPTAAYCGRLRGDALNLTTLACGNRVGRGWVVPGGVRHDLTPEIGRQMKDGLSRLSTDFRSAAGLLWTNSTVLARFEDTGTISSDDASELGLVGLPARASGLGRDTRVEFPYPPYRALAPATAVMQSGDVHARAFVRWLEVERSIAYTEELLATLAGGAAKGDVGPLPNDSIVVSLVEGWRGEVCHVVRTDSAGHFSDYKIYDPSFHNWPGLALALRGQQISDFPLCNKSFNLSYCGHDL